jgi:hypothetical protein
LKVKFVLGFFPLQMQVKQTLEMPREVPTYRHLVNMCKSPHPASGWHDPDVWPLHPGVVNRFMLFQLQRPICSTIIHWCNVQFVWYLRFFSHQWGQDSFFDMKWTNLEVLAYRTKPIFLQICPGYRF